MNPGRIKPLWALLFFALSLALLNRLNQYQVSQDSRHKLPFPSIVEAMDTSSSISLFAQAYQQRLSGMLSVKGVITHVFPEIDSGKSYQKFIVQIDKDLSVVVFHNTEQGSKIDALAVGEIIEVYGQYQWSEDGGIVRLTHQSLGHQAGWVNYKNRLYR